MRFDQPPEIRQSVVQLQCAKCGTETTAPCNCGVKYFPVAVRVAEYDAANPGQSTRQAAADLGVSKDSVHRARAGVSGEIPETVTGRDGKTYRSFNRPKTERRPRAEIQQELIKEALNTITAMNHDTRERFDKLYMKERDDLLTIEF